MMDLYVKSPDLRELPVGELVAVYHRMLGGLCLLDAEASAILQRFASPCEVVASILDGSAKDLESQLVRQLVARRLLVREDGQAPSAALGGAEEGARPKVNVVQLVLVNACNFGCKYCFEGVQGADLSREEETVQLNLKSRLQLQAEGPLESVGVNLNDSVYSSEVRLAHQLDPANRLMKPEAAVEYVDKAIRIAKATGVSGLMIQFFGGEPLLNWPAIRAVLQRFGTGAEHGITLAYTIVTNGSLITEEVASLFAEHRVGVCVSFDSIKSKSRPLKNGKDSMPIVVEGLARLQKHGNRVAINAALSSDTWAEFDESLAEFAEEYGAREIGVVVDLDPNFYGKYGHEKIIDKLWRLVEAGSERGIVVTGYWHQIFQLLAGFNVVRQRGFKNCSAKGAQLSIEPNGAVFACKASSGYFGSIQEGEKLLDSDTYQHHSSLRYENPEFCHGCEIEGFCGGLCLGPIEKKFGHIDSVEASACDVYRGVTRKFIQSLEPFQVPTFDLAAARAAQP
jgi:uncharacterized protein